MARDQGDGLPIPGKSPLLVLEELARQDQPIRVEIEGYPVRFISRLSLRHGVVLIHKPSDLQLGPLAGGFARVGLPQDPKRELRMEVLVPHLVLADGTSAFICHAPVSLHAGRRESARHLIGGAKTVRLHVGDTELVLTDISLRGCRVVLADPGAPQRFPLGEKLGPARLVAGTLATIELQLVIPRVHAEQFIGCEFRPSRDGRSEQALLELLASLERVPERRHAAS